MKITSRFEINRLLKINNKLYYLLFQPPNPTKVQNAGLKLIIPNGDPNNDPNSLEYGKNKYPYM